METTFFEISKFKNIKKQARKGFRPPSAMKRIGYFQNLRNVLRIFLEFFWKFLGKFFGGFVGGFFGRNFGRNFWRNFLGGFFFGGIFLEDFFGRNTLGGIT